MAEPGGVINPQWPGMHKAELELQVIALTQPLCAMSGGRSSCEAFDLFRGACVSRLSFFQKAPGTSASTGSGGPSNMERHLWRRGNSALQICV